MSQKQKNLLDLDDLDKEKTLDELTDELSQEVGIVNQQVHLLEEKADTGISIQQAKNVIKNI